MSTAERRIYTKVARRAAAKYPNYKYKETAEQRAARVRGALDTGRWIETYNAILTMLAWTSSSTGRQVD
jgi:hypothetical protein